MKRLTIKQFANIYKEEDETRTPEQITVETLNYWRVCGCANMQEELNQLSKNARVKLFHICDNYLYGKDVPLMRDLIYKSLY